MTTEFDLTKEDLSAFNLYHHFHSPAARKDYYRGWFIPAVIWLCVCLALWYLVDLKRGTPWRSFVDLLPLFAGVVAHLCIFPWWYRRKVRKLLEGMISEGKNRGLFGRHTVTISPDNITRTGAYGQNTTIWSGVEKIIVTPEYLFIYLNSMAAVVIPRRAFAGSSEFERFVVAARGYHEKAQALAALASR